MARKQKTGQKMLVVVVDCSDSVLKRIEIERPRATRKRIATTWLREHIDGRAHREGSKRRIVLIFGNDLTGEDYELTYKTWHRARSALVERLTELSLKGQQRLSFSPV